MLYGTQCWSAKKQHINEMRNEGKLCKRWFGHVQRRATYESVKKKEKKNRRWIDSNWDKRMIYNTNKIVEVKN